LLKSKRLANASLDAVTVCRRRGVLARDQDTEPRPTRIASPEKKRVARQAAPLARA
jgi:hypothetical protein